MIKHFLTVSGCFYDLFRDADLNCKSTKFFAKCLNILNDKLLFNQYNCQNKLLEKLVL